MDRLTEIASPDQKARMRDTAERFGGRKQVGQISKKELLNLYANDVSRLLNELQILTERIGQLERRSANTDETKQVFGARPIRRTRITDNRPNPT